MENVDKYKKEMKKDRKQAQSTGESSEIQIEVLRSKFPRKGCAIELNLITRPLL